MIMRGVVDEDHGGGDGGDDDDDDEAQVATILHIGNISFVETGSEVTSVIILIFIVDPL